MNSKKLLYIYLIFVGIPVISMILFVSIFSNLSSSQKTLNNIYNTFFNPQLPKYKVYWQGDYNNGLISLIQTDDNNYIILTPSSITKIDENNQKLLVNSLPIKPDNITQDKEGNIYVFGVNSNDNINVSSYSTVKYNKAGEYLSIVNYNLDVHKYYLKRIIPLVDGSTILCGFYESKIFVVKIDALDNIVWEHTYDINYDPLNNNEKTLYTLISFFQTQDNNIIVSGNINNNNYYNDQKNFLICINQDGEEQWRTITNKYKKVFFNQVIEAHNGNIIAIGKIDLSNNQYGTFIDIFDKNGKKVNEIYNMNTSSNNESNSYLSITEDRDGNLTIIGISNYRDYNYQYKKYKLIIDEYNNKYELISSNSLKVNNNFHENAIITNDKSIFIFRNTSESNSIIKVGLNIRHLRFSDYKVLIWTVICIIISVSTVIVIKIKSSKRKQTTK